MKILSLDTSATVATVALLDGDKLLAEQMTNNGNTHSETILPMIEDALASADLNVADIDLFACSCGPGSFTGVRIGVATLKGLAFASDKPCVGVSTLEALAENLKCCGGLICPVMNARRSQVYTALFISDGQSIKRVTEDEAISISELDEMLSKYGAPVSFCGDGYDITLEALTKTRAKDTPLRLRYQSAASVAEVALRKYEAGKYSDDAGLKVTYLRPSQAERELKEKQKTSENKNN